MSSSSKPGPDEEVRGTDADVGSGRVDATSSASHRGRGCAFEESIGITANIE